MEVSFVVVLVSAFAFSLASLITSFNNSVMASPFASFSFELFGLIVSFVSIVSIMLFVSVFAFPCCAFAAISARRAGTFSFAMGFFGMVV